MIINIGNNHTVRIGHLTKMGSLNDVLAIGNSYRRSKNLREIRLDEWIAKESTWEFIIKVFNENQKKSKPEFPVLDIAPILGSFQRDLKNRILYGEMLKKKQFVSVIKSQRGGKPENRGLWANLFILLDLATFLDVDLKYEMYDIFINSKILHWRDLGGDEYTELNKIVKMLPNSKGQKDRIDISLAMRKKLAIFDTRGYNDKDHNAFIQEKRAEYLKDLKKFIQLGFIKNVDELIDALGKLK